MIHFCTQLDSASVERGRALYRSLQQHSKDAFSFTALRSDEAATLSGTGSAALLKELSLPALLAAWPTLAAARHDRTPQEFHQTCQAWLMRHLLAEIPEGELLFYVAPEMFFFGPPEALAEKMQGASVGLSPCRYPAALEHLERLGRFDPGLVGLRHDPTGSACAADWAERCARWCFQRVEADRYAQRKYLDRWSAAFPQTVVLDSPGAIAAPWQLDSDRLSASPEGPTFGGERLIAFHFAALEHLGAGLYDAGLSRHGVAITPAIRELLYQPYLRLLHPDAADALPPDLIPPSRPDDPRAAPALARATELLHAAQSERTLLQRTLEHQHRRAQCDAEERRVAEARAEQYLGEVESDRAALRTKLIECENKLLKAYDDILRYVDTLKTLKSESEAMRRDKDAQIASLASELAQDSGARAEQPSVRPVLEPYARDLRRLVVVKYHPRLLPQILWFATMGTQIEVLGSPPELAQGRQGPVQFRPQTLWEWLGQIDSFFNERAYRESHPDVAAAVDQGLFASGWEHYVRFGQREYRAPGKATYCTGLAEFDGVAFDGSDAAEIVPCLFGRLQPEQRLFISGFVPPTDWLPPDEGRNYLLGSTLFCPRPPRFWLGPRQPANGLAPHLPEVSRADLFPENPSQQAVWPRLSVIVPCHGPTAMIEASLRSVLEQNYPKTELIAVVTRRTSAEAAALVRHHAARLILLEMEEEASDTAALNLGLHKATGGLINWLNPGERLAPGSLYQVAQFSLLHQADIFAGRCARVPAGEVQAREIHRSVLPFDRITDLPREDLLDLERAWLKDCFFDQPEVFLSRSCIERAGGGLREDLTAARDYDFWLRLAKTGARIFALPEIIGISTLDGARRVEAAGLTELQAVSTAHRAST